LSQPEQRSASFFLRTLGALDEVCAPPLLADLRRPYNHGYQQVENVRASTMDTIKTVMATSSTATLASLRFITDPA
jgi:hypothetical protein